MVEAAKCNVTRYSEDGTRLHVDDKVGQMMEGVTLDAENVSVPGDQFAKLDIGNWPMIVF